MQDEVIGQYTCPNCKEKMNLTQHNIQNHVCTNHSSEEERILNELSEEEWFNSPNVRLLRSANDLIKNARLEIAEELKLLIAELALGGTIKEFILSVNNLADRINNENEP